MNTGHRADSNILFLQADNERTKSHGSTASERLAASQNPTSETRLHFAAAGRG